MQSIGPNQPDAWAKLVPLSLPLDSRNLSLTKDSCTIGKAETNDIQIFDSRIDDVHYRIYKETNNIGYDLYWIENLSCAGIVVEDKLINNRNKHRLAPGDKIGFLSLDEMRSETILTHIFCPSTKESNKGKRCEEENSTEELGENKEYVYKNNIECSICLCIIYNCVTVLPCLHNFCASCISDWILESKVCPNCKQEYSDLNKNSKIDEMVNSYIAANPEIKESKEYYDEKDKKDRIKSQPLFAVVTFSDGTIYEGEWVNGRRQGKGKLIHINGNIYDGDWVNNEKEGKGKGIYADGAVYEGDWTNGKMEGKGKMISAEGHIYEGDWINNKKEGKGKAIYADGAVYEGDWITDIMEGKGKMIYPQGHIYEGDWINNKMEGKGKALFIDGGVYEGDWVKDKQEGKGKMIFAQGHIYEGDWLNNNQEGKGKMIYPQGHIYEGEWVNNKQEGKGKFIHAKGDVYEGDWVNNKMEGKGKLIYTNGDVYEGDLANNKREGKGQMIYANGEVYEGDWANNKKEGKGKMIYADGAVYEGNWVNNEKKETECKS